MLYYVSHKPPNFGDITCGGKSSALFSNDSEKKKTNIFPEQESNSRSSYL